MRSPTDNKKCFNAPEPPARESDDRLEVFPEASPDLRGERVSIKHLKIAWDNDTRDLGTKTML